MNASTNPYTDHRYPTEIIRHAVWLNFRDVEELLAARGTLMTYKSIRQWCIKFSKEFANEIRHRKERPGDIWFLDEVFITINGER
jgi:putative transposase